jgi:hypothetical protein
MYCCVEVYKNGQGAYLGKVKVSSVTALVQELQKLLPTRRMETVGNLVRVY